MMQENTTGLAQDAGPAVPEDAFDLKRALQIAGGLFLALAALAAFVPMGGAVIGMGQIVVESRVKRIAHPTGGAIAEILVRNGQRVEAGQVLLRLKDNVSGADATYSSQIVEQLLAERARLEAERKGAAAIAWPPELAQAGSPAARQAMLDARQLFNQRRSEEAQLRAQLAQRIEQYSEEIGGLEAQIKSLERQRVLIEEERVAIRQLWEKRLVTISRINQLERAAADIDGNIGALRSRIAQARARIAETRQQSIQLGETRRVQAGEDLAQINTSLSQQQLRSVAATDQHDNSEIRAPYAGTVEKLAFSSIGEVIRSAEPIMEIVPDDEQKVVEVTVLPEDIDQVRTGQTAYVRFTSFNMASTPQLRGKVAYVATDRTDNPQNNHSYYIARVVLDPAELRAARLDLRSGIPAETHIETASRSLLSYMFKPLRDQFARAFTDN